MARGGAPALLSGRMTSCDAMCHFYTRLLTVWWDLASRWLVFCFLAR